MDSPAATSSPIVFKNKKLENAKAKANLTTEENISEIKLRVAKAASEGLSQIAYGNLCVPEDSFTPRRSTRETLGSSKNSVCRRPSSVWNFSDQDMFPVYKLSYLPSIPPHNQESVLVHEVLHCMVGVRGMYIVPAEGSITEELGDIGFNISDKIPISLRDLVTQILPLASDYSLLDRFSNLCDDTDIGLVKQALGSAIQNLIFDYYVFLVQLESEYLDQTLTLTKLLFFVRPTMSVFRTLAKIIRTIHNQDLHGAQILTHLYDQITDLTGDSDAQTIIINLTQAASVPYIEMLQVWIEKGVIIDPLYEFFVEDNEIIKTHFMNLDHYSAEYWEKRYTIRRDKVPRFFADLSDVILRAGKYLNVIQQCGVKQFGRSESGEVLQFCPTDMSVHTQFIEKAYTMAARTLLKVLVKDNDLMGHLQSVKRYLLLHQGDFINQFMDAAEKELAKNVDKVLPMRLENLLGLTLRLSSTKFDKYNDDLHCQLFPFELNKQMEKIHLAGTNDEEYWHDNKINLTGLECFAFRYEVHWPTSLVLNHFAILEYQMLFRQLFYCKHVERQLCKVWKDNNNAKKFAPESAELYRSAFTLRQRMMNAIQNLEYYMMIEVIEPTWHEFVNKMGNVSNVDEVLIVHQDFLDDCLYNCMLKTPALLRSVTKLCNMCLSFCKFIQKAQQYFVDAELTSMLRSEDSSDTESEPEMASHMHQNETSLAPTDTFSERIKRFDLEFTFILIGLLKQINEISYENPNSKLINLVHRINFNSFYNQHLDQMSASHKTSVLKSK